LKFHIENPPDNPLIYHWSFVSNVHHPLDAEEYPSKYIYMPAMGWWYRGRVYIGVEEK
jgi:hypothetical protein